MELTHHFGEEFGHNATSLPHLALLAVWQVRDDPHYVTRRGGLTGISHDQQLHDIVVDISGNINTK